MQKMFLARFDDINGRIDSLVQDQQSARSAIADVLKLVEEQNVEDEKHRMKIRLIEERLDTLTEKVTQIEKTLSELKTIPVKRDAEITQTVKKWIIGAVGASITAAVMAAIAKIAGLIK
jgi:predicted  nucleic acid-binding Zn-ribbon protein